MDKLDSYHLPVTGKNILRFAFPTIVMTVFNTFYTMVDGRPYEQRQKQLMTYPRHFMTLGLHPYPSFVNLID